MTIFALYESFAVCAYKIEKVPSRNCMNKYKWMFRNKFRGLIYEISVHDFFVHMYVSYIHVKLDSHESIARPLWFLIISHIRLYSRSSRFVIMYTLIVEKDLLFCITNNEISVQEISRILSVKKNRYSILLRGSQRRAQTPMISVIPNLTSLTFYINYSIFLWFFLHEI